MKRLYDGMDESQSALYDSLLADPQVVDNYAAPRAIKLAAENRSRFLFEFAQTCWSREEIWSLCKGTKHEATVLALLMDLS